MGPEAYSTFPDRTLHRDYWENLTLIRAGLYFRVASASGICSILRRPRLQPSVRLRLLRGPAEASIHNLWFATKMGARLIDAIFVTSGYKVSKCAYLVITVSDDHLCSMF